MKTLIIISSLFLIIKGLSLGAAAFLALAQNDEQRMTLKDWAEAITILVLFLLIFSFVDIFVGATSLRFVFAG